MRHEDGSGCRDDCRACNNKLLGAVYIARRVCAAVAVGAAICALVWDTTWMPVWPATGAWIGITGGLWAPVPFLRITLWRRGREIEKRRAQIRELQQEKIQLDILHTQRQAHITALRAEKLELERLLAQRMLEQEAREARQRLEIACAAVEADRLEAAAWRMELTAKQLELKLGQADLFESLSAIEDDAQDRIMAAYQQGVDHGKRGIIIPLKHLRHLRVVDESA
ncbi:hypothetical protein [Streptomyces sp. NPDC001530]|uniref:hypothetical protein n=1 Tax=Streptomyces sp. NPDC001530 TaxID=3364582 RepID=UPI0036940228